MVGLALKGFCGLSETKAEIELTTTCTSYWGYQEWLIRGAILASTLDITYVSS